MAYQKIIIRGNLGGDPELRYMPSGKAVVNFTVAVGEKWRDKDSGEMQEHVEWFRVEAFEKKAETIAEHFTKGSGILVEGKRRTEKWKDKESGQDRQSEKLVLQSFDFIDRKSES